MAMHGDDNAQQAPLTCLIQLGWNREFGVASLRALSHDEPALLRHDLAVATANPRRLAAMGYVRHISEFLGVGRVGALPFEPSIISSPYAVRVHDERKFEKNARAELLGAVWDAAGAAAVELRSPRTELHAFATSKGVAWGRSIDVTRFEPGDQQSRPFVRSYVVPSRKARWLNDLAAVDVGHRVLDPFCGTGSILIEAERLGAIVFGSDVDAVAVAGARENFRARRATADLRVMDARHQDGWATQFDAVVTDLPYGRSAAIRADDIASLAMSWLTATTPLLLPGARIVAMAPSGVLAAEATGLEVCERLTERVHRSLTREIVVYESERGTVCDRLALLGEPD